MSYSALFSQLVDSSEVTGALRRDSAHYQRMGFSEDQALAVSAPLIGDICLLAGPGAGKTKVLVERVKHLISAGVPPESILVCTFTRNAAREVVSRIKSSSTRIPEHIGTIHGLSLRLAKNKSSFQLMPDTRLEELALAAAIKSGVGLELTGAELVMEFNRMREEAYIRRGWEKGAEAFHALLADQPDRDFLSLIEQVVQDGPKRRFMHILVDEAQDLTSLQQAWLNKVAKKGSQLFLVGDEDQSIYGFRGFQGGAMGQLARKPGTMTLFLSDNYRSMLSIFAAAKNIIDHNTLRQQKQPKCHQTEPGFVYREVYRDIDSECAEAQAVYLKYPSFCVLGRTQKSIASFKDKGLPALTVHQAKGNEFDYVWITGCDEGLLPHCLNEDVEEERRLFYVALTRARQGVWLISKATSKPSRFLDELIRSPLVINQAYDSDPVF